MLNIEDPCRNDFEVVGGDQEKLMTELDKAYDIGMHRPLIIVAGQVHLMIDPAVYASLLLLKQIMAEKAD